MNQDYILQNKAIFQKYFSQINPSEKLVDQILQLADQEKAEEAVPRDFRRYKGLFANSIFKHPRRILSAAVLVAAVLICTLMAYAALCQPWNRVDEKSFGTELESQTTLLELGFAASFDEDSDRITDAGITVFPSSLITDGEMLFLSFVFEGYDYEFLNNSFPKFVYPPEISLIDEKGNIWYLTDHSCSRSHGFYKYAEQGPLYNLSNSPGIDMPVYQYRNQDGNLEYCELFFLEDIVQSNDVESFFNMRLHVLFQGLGAQNPDSDAVWTTSLYGEEKGFEHVADGTWEMELKTPDGAEAQKHIRTCKTNQKVTGTSWILDTVSISPISARINYHLEETEATKYLHDVGPEIRLTGIQIAESQETVCHNDRYRDRIIKNMDRIGHIREQHLVLDKIIDPLKVTAVYITTKIVLYSGDDMKDCVIIDLQ